MGGSGLCLCLYVPDVAPSCHQRKCGLQDQAPLRTRFLHDCVQGKHEIEKAGVGGGGGIPARGQGSEQKGCWGKGAASWGLLGPRVLPSERKSCSAPGIIPTSLGPDAPTDSSQRERRVGRTPEPLAWQGGGQGRGCLSMDLLRAQGPFGPLCLRCW